MANRPPLITYLFLWLFIVVGVASLCAGIWNLARSLRSASWPSTSGVIDRAEMGSNSDDDGVTYSADVTYHYEVGGTSYTGTRLSFGTMSASSDYARRILDRYPVGATVRVYYSPDDPASAVLETGIHGGTWICFSIGAMFILVASAFLRNFGKATASGGQFTYAPANTPGAQKPPIWMGIIFMAFGFFAIFSNPSPGLPQWVDYVGGSVFVLGGLFLLACRLQDKTAAKVLGVATVLTLLGMFHWVAFAPGERTGTMSTPFSTTHDANVKPAFAVVMLLFDALLLVVIVKNLIKRRKG